MKLSSLYNALYASAIFMVLMYPAVRVILSVLTLATVSVNIDIILLLFGHENLPKQINNRIIAAVHMFIDQ